MATLSNTALTLLDQAKRTDPTGKSARIVEMLAQENRMLDDALYIEGNVTNGYEVTQRTGLPTAYYRKANQGIPSSKSTTAQIVESTAHLEARSHVDVLVARRLGVAATRMAEAPAFTQAMNQQAQDTLLYGTEASPEQYPGFMSRYDDLSAVAAENIIDAGGTSTDNLSVILVGWGADGIFCTFPKNTSAGLQHQDLGEDDVEDASGNTYRAFKDLWSMDSGLVVKDWRYGVRIANVDVSDLVGKTGTQAVTAATSVINLMSQAIDHLPSAEKVNPVFYANRTLLSHLRILALDKSNDVVTIEKAINQFGKDIRTMHFLGIPIRLVDRLLNTEARIV